jgi:hypothetical protein
MPDWNQVGRAHVLAAIAEHDRLGSREFHQRYRFGRSPAAALWHQGQEYDSKAILGVAYLHANGRAAMGDELPTGSAEAAQTLTALGFDVVVDTEALAAEKPRPARKAAASKPAARKAAARKPAARSAAPTTARRATPQAEVKICPTCHMAIPATGICDNCD